MCRLLHSLTERRLISRDEHLSNAPGHVLIDGIGRRALAAQGATIYAVKAVWRWLESLGVTPDYCAMLDPHPSQARYVEGAPKAMKWLIASQCDPATFDALDRQGADVTLYHVPTIGSLNPALPKGVMLIPGGGGVGSRTARISALMQHKPIHLFGFDCCYQNGSSADPKRIEKGATASHVYYLARGRDDVAPIEMNGRIYLSTWAFLTETVDIMQLCASGAIPQLKVYGPGMLADTLREYMAIQKHAQDRPPKQITGETFAGAPKEFRLGAPVMSQPSALQFSEARA